MGHTTVVLREQLVSCLAAPGKNLFVNESFRVPLRDTLDGLLVLGLVLSAAMPWLLTGLFLRPGGPRSSDDIDHMQEAGA